MEDGWSETIPIVAMAKLMGFARAQPILRAGRKNCSVPSVGQSSSIVADSRSMQLYERFLDSYRFDDAAPGSVASPLAGEAAA